MTDVSIPPTADTTIRTLGKLELSGLPFNQTRSLMLVAYLALEGPKPRRFLAELFWPDGNDSLNSLSVSLSKLRRLGVADADEARAWATVPGDLEQLRSALASGDMGAALELYSGGFLERVASRDLGPELEEWVLSTRENLARDVREALLAAAERCAAQGNFEQAGTLAAQASGLPHAPLLEAGELIRAHTLLLAAQHPAAQALEREAHELGLSVTTDHNDARGQLRQNFVGRETELARLRSLAPGAWVWLRGNAGMGKTALLQELAARTGWTYLPARSGLPYATLEPLLGQIEGGEGSALRRLAGSKYTLLLDDWSSSDPESQALLLRLRALKPECRVVLAGRGDPPLPTEHLIDLHPINETALSAYPGAFQATGGSPHLIGAWLRGQPLCGALEQRLASLSEASRQTYFVLALLDKADFRLIRQALSLDAEATAEVIEQLMSSGLIDASGRVYAQATAREHLAAHPLLEADLSLRLARCGPEGQAYTLFRRARALWQDSDLDLARTAYLHAATETLRRGFPRQAADILTDAPASPAVTLLRAQALERAGSYKDAMAELDGSPETLDVIALKGTLYWRLGKPDEARAAATRALSGEMVHRAQALNTLGYVSFSEGNYREAEELFQKSSGIWLALGNNEMRFGAMSNRALSILERGGDAEGAYLEVLKIIGGHSSLRATCILNLGICYERKGKSAKAEEAFKQSIKIAEDAGVDMHLIHSLNSLGTLFHTNNRLSEARVCYERALKLARESGERFLLGLVLSNLAELTEDVGAWEESLLLLKDAGHDAMHDRVKADLDRFRAVSGV
jgi:tetratricopeptide (TPR) repeat protein